MVSTPEDEKNLLHHHAQPGLAELTALEEQVTAALEAQDESLLTIIGRGEMTIALGWPTDDPHWVCKRTPPCGSEAFERYKSLVYDYVDQLRASGQAVVDTEVIGLERGDAVVCCGPGQRRSRHYVVALPAEAACRSDGRSPRPALLGGRFSRQKPQLQLEQPRARPLDSGRAPPMRP